MLLQRFTRPGRLALLLPLTAALVGGCATSEKPSSMAGTYEGPPVDIGQGQARAFVKLDDRGQASTLGVRLSDGVLNGLPTDPPPTGEWEYELALPAEAKASGYDHISVDWNPHGHEPKGVYDIPHFDFHFYHISQAAQDSITATGADLERAHRAPPADEMPAGYILPPGTEVPKMGAHAIDPAAPEFHHQTFTHTFIYGFYDAKITFVEPMVSLAFLKTHPDVSETVKQPKVYATHFYYPTRYGVHYDTDKKQFDITLDDLKPH